MKPSSLQQLQERIAQKQQQVTMQEQKLKKNIDSLGTQLTPGGILNTLVGTKLNASMGQSSLLNFVLKEGAALGTGILFKSLFKIKAKTAWKLGAAGLGIFLAASAANSLKKRKGGVKTNNQSFKEEATKA